METDPKDVVDFVLQKKKAAELKSFEPLLISKTRCKGGTRCSKFSIFQEIVMQLLMP